MILKKIYELPRTDRRLWNAFAEFMAFYDPTVRWKSQDYRFETGVVRAEPVDCGADLRAVADLVLDHGGHRWQPYQRDWAQSALNSGVRLFNNGQMFRRVDKHTCYDVMARAMHPRDRHPTTVLLPEFFPHTPDQESQRFWEQEQVAVVASTTRGFDPGGRHTDWDQVQTRVRASRRLHERQRQLRAGYYASHDALKDTVDRHFNGRFPLFVRVSSSQNSDGVTKVHALEQLCQVYERTRGGTVHLQEAIERYDVHARCMAVGPQVLFMDYRPDAPMHSRHGERPLVLGADTAARLRSYVRFVDAYHRWSHNAFEAVVADDVIHPVDYANASPDCALTSLDVHFPWVLCALVRWCTFVVVADVDLRVDLEQKRYRAILQDPAQTPEEKHAACAALGREYFRVDEFDEYCASALPGLEDAMARFYDAHGDRLVETQVRASDLPAPEHARFVDAYRRKLDADFRPNAHAMLRAGVGEG